MKSNEALKSICLECEREKGKNKIACPFRSVSNEYCEEYDLMGKYIILVKGHYVASWNNTYFSTFNNDNDEVVALWELEDVNNG